VNGCLVVLNLQTFTFLFARLVQALLVFLHRLLQVVFLHLGQLEESLDLELAFLLDRLVVDQLAFVGLLAFLVLGRSLFDRLA
jgi:hypothetical protein